MMRRSVGFVVFNALLFRAEITCNMTAQAGNRRQGRTLGPILGLLLSGLLANSGAKYYYPSGSFHFSYDSQPWLAYNKPQYPEHHHQQPSHFYWHPYAYRASPPHPPFPSLTTEANAQTVAVFGEDAHHENAPAGLITNIESPTGFAEEFASSNANSRRRQADNPNSKSKNRRRGADKRRKNNRRPTTQDLHDGDYEDATTRANKIRRKTRPTAFKRRRTTTPAYYDEDYGDGDSYETTFGYNQRRRQRPGGYDNESHDDVDYDNSEDYGSVEGTSTDEDFAEETSTRRYVSRRKPQRRTRRPSEKYATTSDGFFARQEDREETTATTMMPTTTPMANATNATTTGYGPDTGKGNISITYGPPPQSGFDNRYPFTAGYGGENVTLTYGPPSGAYFQPPIAGWYSNFATKSAVVKKVHDLVAYDNDFYSQFNNDGAS